MGTPQDAPRGGAWPGLEVMALRIPTRAAVAVTLFQPDRGRKRDLVAPA
jgi:hypothetical protein